MLANIVLSMASFQAPPCNSQDNYFLAFGNTENKVWSATGSLSGYMFKFTTGPTQSFQNDYAMSGAEHGNGMAAQQQFYQIPHRAPDRPQYVQRTSPVGMILNGGNSVADEDEMDVTMAESEGDRVVRHHYPVSDVNSMTGQQEVARRALPSPHYENQHTTSVGVAFHNGYSMSPVNHEELKEAQQDFPHQVHPAHQPMDRAFSAPVQPVAGLKRKADDFDSSSIRVEYEMAGDEFLEAQTDPNSQHAALARLGHLPRKYMPLTSRLRRGVRDVTSYASRLGIALASFGINREPAEESIPLRFDVHKDTKLINPYKRSRR